MIESLDHLLAAWTGLTVIPLCGFAWESVSSWKAPRRELALQAPPDLNELLAGLQYELEALP